MKIKVKVHSGSSVEKIEKGEDFYEVWIKERAIEGKANRYLEKFLKSKIGSAKVVSGFRSKIKFVEVEDEI